MAHKHLAADTTLRCCWGQHQYRRSSWGADTNECKGIKAAYKVCPWLQTNIQLQTACGLHAIQHMYRHGPPRPTAATTHIPRGFPTTVLNLNLKPCDTHPYLCPCLPAAPRASQHQAHWMAPHHPHPAHAPSHQHCCDACPPARAWGD
jgi:hypothetical protein